MPDDTPGEKVDLDPRSYGVGSRGRSAAETRCGAIDQGTEHHRSGGILTILVDSS
jgi:hypothetical protein